MHLEVLKGPGRTWEGLGEWLMIAMEDLMRGGQGGDGRR